ncbi:hypothetical protein [Ramlibacter tataouinensis]|uniref:Uncharacterized protein n=1 Tax=Ramlibacter tataouinensis (strain ATCC BAA-407 / DSM 14655 / LMG 21543 / TTB310) TaxID=365046 RepID=F5XXC8_RAMTT|nr:hypothetical protein [Ramlibacter tataouinensis]AEG94263.1 hypothetical protein Rta_31520 [Ramlibacter tataouinensis TTB310]
MADAERIPLTRRLARHLQRWGAYWVAALALLAASEVLWWWQTWPVRELLPAAQEPAA